MRIQWFLMAFLTAFGLSAPALGETYKWVDENGVTHYGDRIPPKYAKQQREVLNQSGDTVKVLQHEKTAEERAEDVRKEQLAKEEKEQQRKDSFLLSTYDDEGDMQSARNDQLGSLDGNLRISEIALEGTEKDLNSRKERQAQLVKDGKPVPPDLERQIKSLETRVERDRKTLAQRQQERERVSSRWDRDIQRWRQLKAASTGGAEAASAPNQGANTGVGK